ncbi:hypothetical protein BJ742DRAFT_734453 [Cladochytrium replicatum]|nr:hypothetical protein BJ742DRAFT_734453 [Cladochytrium replicatum]
MNASIITFKPESDSDLALIQSHLQRIVAILSFGYIRGGFSCADTSPDADIQRAGGAAAVAALKATTGVSFTNKRACLLYPASGFSSDWAYGITKVKFAYLIIPSGNETTAAVAALTQRIVFAKGSKGLSLGADLVDELLHLSVHEVKGPDANPSIRAKRCWGIPLRLAIISIVVLDVVTVTIAILLIFNDSSSLISDNDVIKQARSSITSLVQERLVDASNSIANFLGSAWSWPTPSGFLGFWYGDRTLNLQLANLELNKQVSDPFITYEEPNSVTSRLSAIRDIPFGVISYTDPETSIGLTLTNTIVQYATFSVWGSNGTVMGVGSTALPVSNVRDLLEKINANSTTNSVFYVFTSSGHVIGISEQTLAYQNANSSNALTTIWDYSFASYPLVNISASKILRLSGYNLTNDFSDGIYKEKIEGDDFYFHVRAYKRHNYKWIVVSGAPAKDYLSYMQELLIKLAAQLQISNRNGILIVVALFVGMGALSVVITEFWMIQPINAMLAVIAKDFSYLRDPDFANGKSSGITEFQTFQEKFIDMLKVFAGVLRDFLLEPRGQKLSSFVELPGKRDLSRPEFLAKLEELTGQLQEEASKHLEPIFDQIRKEFASSFESPRCSHDVPGTIHASVCISCGPHRTAYSEQERLQQKIRIKEIGFDIADSTSDELLLEHGSIQAVINALLR